MGALQSIPGELIEAARVDGAGPWQIFRKVTLPLLLVAVAPLLIASFAFNFNNFNNIYLLTGGGPPANDQSVAGATDILISYTYKLAFEAGKGTDYGLASAVSILIFFIVAGDLGDSGSGARAVLEDDAMTSRRPRRVAAARAVAGARRTRRRKKPSLHAGELVASPGRAGRASSFALFPVVYVVSAAFNADGTLRGASA